MNPQQLDFHGRTIQEKYVNIPGLGDVSLSALFPNGDAPEDTPDTGEVWELTMQVAMVKEITEEKHDKEGFATGVLTRKWEFKATRPGLAVTAIFGRARRATINETG